MGPCCFCKKMIYNPWIAERGWHRACKDAYEEKLLAHFRERELCLQRIVKAYRKDEKRRLRRKQLRDIKKGKVKA